MYLFRFTLEHTDTYIYSVFEHYISIYFSSSTYPEIALYAVIENWAWSAYASRRLSRSVWLSYILKYCSRNCLVNVCPSGLQRKLSWLCGILLCDSSIPKSTGAGNSTPSYGGKHYACNVRRLFPPVLLGGEGRTVLIFKFTVSTRSGKIENKTPPPPQDSFYLFYTESNNSNKNWHNGGKYSGRPLIRIHRKQ